MCVCVLGVEYTKSVSIGRELVHYLMSNKKQCTLVNLLLFLSNIA